MAYICTKPPKSCSSCNHYRFDHDRMDYACFAHDDLKKSKQNINNKENKQND